MAKIMKSVTALSILAAAVFAALFRRFNAGVYLSLAITFSTMAYHLGMRLIVGALFDKIMDNKADYTKKRYALRPWENKLYSALNVRAWKDKMPTYDPDVFSLKKHSLEEIAQAMCQSELVHKTNALLSLLPIAAAMRFGSFYVFLITSLCGAAFDLAFVIMQRYNRARIVKIIRRRDKG